MFSNVETFKGKKLCITWQDLLSMQPSAEVKSYTQNRCCAQNIMQLIKLGHFYANAH